VVTRMGGSDTVGTVCAVDRLAGYLRESDDCGAEGEACGDPQRAVHGVHKCRAGGGCDLFGLGAEVLAGF
jgi:hypothetical protein